MHNTIKTALSELVGLSKDALHMHIGLGIFVVALLVFRRQPVIAWLVLLAVELVNELIDIFHWHAGQWTVDIGDSPKDVLNTMLWPTVAVVAILWRRRVARWGLAASSVDIAADRQ